MALKACYCHTPGCANDGVAFLWDDAPMQDEDGTTIEQSPPWCGGCSTRFSDITDAPADAEPDADTGTEPTE